MIMFFDRIGTEIALINANLVINHLGERLLHSWENKPLFWMRFIDDMFYLNIWGRLFFKVR